MVGWITFPRSEKAPDTPITVNTLHLQPPFSDPDANRFSQPCSAGTLPNAARKTSRSNRFLSLPLWRRRAITTISSDVGEVGQSLTRNNFHVEQAENIARQSTHNRDKDLPAVPPLDESPEFNGQASDGRTMSTFPEVTSQQSQSARTPAPAGLGIGLPLITPSAAAKPCSASVSSSGRPRTAPRPSRLDTNSVVRRVRSFTRFMDGDSPSNSLTGLLSVEKGRLESPMSSNNQRENTGMSDSPFSSMAGRSPLTRRPSLWNQLRAQTHKDPLAENKPDPEFTSKVLASSPKSDLEGQKPCIGERSRASKETQSGLPPSLHRRHSDRTMSASRHSNSSEGSSQRFQSRKRNPRRPSTAGDGARRLDKLSTVPNGTVNTAYPSSRMSQCNAASVSNLALGSTHGMPRPRANTNPHNLLSRLSMGFFNHSNPASPFATNSSSASLIHSSSSPCIRVMSHRTSLSKIAMDIPKPRENEESPELFLKRVRKVVGKAEVAHVLASSGEPFYSRALQIYVDGFDFSNDPLDIALRKLLMEVELPKETQQIDRVIEAFASSYNKSNPGLFVSEDHPYILAFSLIMLHTDAFNKSNKRKMSKVDYIKNTKLVGVPTEVLGYFYDNTVFAPFIFIEEPLGVNGHRGTIPDTKSQQLPISNMATSAMGNGLSVLGKSNKVDPYYLITQNLLGPLRIDIEYHIPRCNPFSYQGTVRSWNGSELRRSLAQAFVAQMDLTQTKRMSSMPFFAMNSPDMTIDESVNTVSEQDTVGPNFKRLRITKVGLLNRKDDLSSGGARTARRKWREWSVVLTGSQLLFFRDSALAANIVGRLEEKEGLSHPLSLFRPEEILPIKGSIAVFDSSYVKHPNVLHLIMPDGRQILLQTENDAQRNEWIAHINYSGAFKSTGIKMRPVWPLSSSLMDCASSVKDVPKSMPIIADAETPSRQRSSEDDTETPLFRSRIISKIQELEVKLKATEEKINASIRTARNFAILTPFQKATRAHLRASALNLGKYIRQLRLEIVRTSCYRDVLAADLASEERERQHKERDKSDCGRRSRPSEDTSLPRMTVSLHQDAVRNRRQTSHSDVSEMSEGRRTSSFCESYHSSLDLVEWHFDIPSASPTQQRSKDMNETNSALANPGEELSPGDSTRTGYFTSLEGDRSKAPSSVSTIGSFAPDDQRLPEEVRQSGPEASNEDIEEQAEEWNKTKAAKRVSLVRVPSTLRMSPDRRESWQRSILPEDKLDDSSSSFSDDRFLLKA